MTIRPGEDAVPPVSAPQLSEAAIGEALGRVQVTRPLVHQIAGPVSLADTVNAILAFGGTAVAAVAGEEIEEIAGQADALVLNLGMLDTARLEAMRLAGAAANERHVPVVLDPVAVGATVFRATAVRELLARLRVTVIRGNAGEIVHLAYGWPSVRGVDTAIELPRPHGGSRDIGVIAASGPEDPHPGSEERTVIHRAAAVVSARWQAVVAATGPEDVIRCRDTFALVQNGSPLLARISGAGCIASALVACCLGARVEPLLATATALVAIGVAGERAAQRAAGPGSFRSALLDELAALTPARLAAEARICWGRDAAAPGLEETDRPRERRVADMPPAPLEAG